MLENLKTFKIVVDNLRKLKHYKLSALENLVAHLGGELPKPAHLGVEPLNTYAPNIVLGLLALIPFCIPLSVIYGPHLSSLSDARQSNDNLTFVASRSTDTTQTTNINSEPHITIPEPKQFNGK